MSHKSLNYERLGWQMFADRAARGDDNKPFHRLSEGPWKGSFQCLGREREQVSVRPRPSPNRSSLF